MGQNTHARAHSHAHTHVYVRTCAHKHTCTCNIGKSLLGRISKNWTDRYVVADPEAGLFTTRALAHLSFKVSQKCGQKPTDLGLLANQRSVPVICWNQPVPQSDWKGSGQTLVACWKDLPFPSPALESAGRPEPLL